MSDFLLKTLVEYRFPFILFIFSPFLPARNERKTFLCVCVCVWVLVAGCVCVRSRNNRSRWSTSDPERSEMTTAPPHSAGTNWRRTSSFFLFLPISAQSDPEIFFGGPAQKKVKSTEILWRRGLERLISKRKFRTSEYMIFFFTVHSLMIFLYRLNCASTRSWKCSSWNCFTRTLFPCALGRRQPITRDGERLRLFRTLGNPAL